MKKFYIVIKYFWFIGEKKSYLMNLLVCVFMNEWIVIGWLWKNPVHIQRSICRHGFPLNAFRSHTNFSRKPYQQRVSKSNQTNIIGNADQILWLLLLATKPSQVHKQYSRQWMLYYHIHNTNFSHTDFSVSFCLVWIK